VASKKPPAAAKPKMAPKAGPKEASTKPTASDATKQTTKHTNERESKPGAPKRKAIAGREENSKKKYALSPCTQFGMSTLFLASKSQ
jgi:hypothetical protein